MVVRHFKSLITMDPFVLRGVNEWLPVPSSQHSACREHGQTTCRRHLALENNTEKGENRIIPIKGSGAKDRPANKRDGSHAALTNPFASCVRKHTNTSQPRLSADDYQNTYRAFRTEP